MELNNSVKKYMEADDHTSDMEKGWHIILGVSAFIMIIINMINLAELLTPLTLLAQ